MNPKEKFLESICRGRELKRDLVHVTEITFPCLRKAWLERRLGQFGTGKDILTLFHGTALHISKMLPENEMTLSYKGVIGRLDEYDPEERVLIDKKSIKKIYKTYLPKPEHIFQLEIYALLLAKANKPVPTEYHILYIEKDPEQNRLYPCDVTKKIRDFKDVEDEVMTAKNLILGDSPPPRVCNDWSCDYCPFVPKCYGEGDLTKIPNILAEEVTA